MWYKVLRGDVGLRGVNQEFVVLKAELLSDGEQAIDYDSASVQVVVEDRCLEVDLSRSSDPNCEVSLPNEIFGDDVTIGSLAKKGSISLKRFEVYCDDDSRAATALHFLVSNKPSVLVEWHLGPPKVFEIADYVEF